MTNKEILYTYLGANQDTSKSKHPGEFYYEAGHIKLNSTGDQSTGGITNEKGNEIILEIPDIQLDIFNYRFVYNGINLQFTNPDVFNNIFGTSTPTSMLFENNEIIGHSISRDGIILFTTNPDGIDSIWYLKNVIDSEYDLELLYVRKLGFSKDYPIQAIYNYENENVQKVYWVDGKSQIRHINIAHNNTPDNEPLINSHYTSLDFVGEVNFDQPIIQSIESGGTHTAGTIQYAYNLFRLNGSQTKISPLSRMVSLGKGPNLGGGEINEVVGSSPVVRIDNIDRRYNNIRIYAIKYTSYNEIPSINLIDEREIGNESITFLDDGSSITSLSMEEFLFLGSDPIIPKHIESKDNRLFPANIKTMNFILPLELDCRIYSFRENKDSVDVLDNITGYTNIANGTGLLTINGNFTVNKKHSTINRSFDHYKYRYNSSQLGGDGKYFYSEVSIVSEGDLNDNIENIKFFKDDEIYRIGIQFYNDLGQKSLPQWMFDFKAPEGNLSGEYTSLHIGAKQSLLDLIEDYNANNLNKILGFKILRAERRESDKTILYQGGIGTMVYQNKEIDYLRSLDNPDPTMNVDIAMKVPSYLMRHYKRYPDHNKIMVSTGEPNMMVPIGGEIVDDEVDGILGGKMIENKHMLALSQEIYIDSSRSNKFQYSWIHDKIMQLFSPETIFDGFKNMGNGLVISVKGMANLTNAHSWIEERSINTKGIKNSGKIRNAISYIRTPERIDILEDNNIIDAAKVPFRDTPGYGHFGFITPSGNSGTMMFKMFHKEYDRFSPSPNEVMRGIYGSPLLVERGQGRTTYNDDSKFIFSNSLESLASDGGSSDAIVNIISINSFAARNVTFVLGNSRSLATNDRLGSEGLFIASGLKSLPDCDGEGILIAEIRKPNIQIYMGKLYGGNSYEERKRAVYLEIGNYVRLEDGHEVNIINGGDTFVQNFKFLRIGKTDTEIYSSNRNQISEIVEYTVETTIDLKNRNDSSFGSWDTIFQPQYGDYHEYNRVYSQSPILIVTQDTDYKFRPIDNFDSRIQASSTKIPNESIDSWSNILSNVVMDLDGKYGSINGFQSFNDKIYAFQDNAIAGIEINPRVQIQADDGIGIELGKGEILHDYKYITNSSGSINKWGIISGKKGIYYYDILNKAIGRVPDHVNLSLTDAKGMHSFYTERYNYDDLKIDNPLLKKGALFGIDRYNSDIYFTLLQGNNNYYNFQRQGDADIRPSTWCFNEIRDQFIDLKPGYSDPTRYIELGNKLFTLPDNKTIYEQYKGEYNKFWGEYVPTYITLLINPESNYDCVFDNIQYNSELYLNDIDQPDKTLTHIRAYNEYQDSGRIPLIVGRGSNIRRKFREWRADIPREGRNRIRNPWIYLKLELENETNKKMILHDIIIKYSI